MLRINHAISLGQSFSYENHCKCYKNLISKLWPVLKIVARASYIYLFLSYTYTLLFCCKIKNVVISVFRSN